MSEPSKENQEIAEMIIQDHRTASGGYRCGRIVEALKAKDREKADVIAYYEDCITKAGSERDKLKASLQTLTQERDVEAKRARVAEMALAKCVGALKVIQGFKGCGCRPKCLCLGESELLIFRESVFEFVDEALTDQTGFKVLEEYETMAKKLKMYEDQAYTSRTDYPCKKHDNFAPGCMSCIYTKAVSADAKDKKIESLQDMEQFYKAEMELKDERITELEAKIRDGEGK